jgi:hypothetical protein
MRILILAFCLLFSVIGPAYGSDRIVAVGDVHGAYEAFVKILQTADLIDQNQSWIGGKATLVQLGDVPDRGPRSRDVIDLLMRLEANASQNGRVECILGNREMMNIIGDLRYASPNMPHSLTVFHKTPATGLRTIPQYHQKKRRSSSEPEDWKTHPRVSSNIVPDTVKTASTANGSEAIRPSGEGEHSVSSWRNEPCACRKQC